MNYPAVKDWPIVLFALRCAHKQLEYYNKMMAKDNK